MQMEQLRKVSGGPANYFKHINKMKKLSLYVFLVLMFCNTAFAECIEGDCSNGYGTYTNPSGNKYVGEWKENKKHGQGTQTYADGRKDAGEWKEDKFVK